MRGFLVLMLCLTGSMVSATPSSDAPTLKEIWQLVQQQQQEIAALKAELADAKGRANQALESTRITEEQLGSTADFVEQLVQDTSTRTRDSATHIGGYGEMHYSNLDADDGAQDVDELDFHRFVMFIDHEFSDSIRFFSEWELEHSLLADTDDGSSKGEVELEQAYIDIDLNENHYLRSGLFLIPVGILNETHEPSTFYGVERNDVENIILPTTWWEGGVATGGHYGNGLSWDLALHSGLKIPTTGSSAFRVRSGRQKVSEASADDLAYTLRLRYSGVPGLEISGSYQHQNDVSQSSGDGLESGDLLSLHTAFTRGPFSLKALWAEWNFDGNAVSLADADQQNGWYLEPSYRFAVERHQFGFYSRYEDIEGARSQDRFQQWELGLNYWPLDNVVFKLDYRNREHDLDAESGRDFSGIDLGLGYQF